MPEAKRKEELLDGVTKYLYSTASSPEFYDYLLKNMDEIRKYVKEKGLMEKREHENLYESDQIRMNYERYAEVFRLGNKMNNTDNFLRRADYLVTVMGITLNTSAFLNTIELLGDPEQAKMWRDLVMSAQAIGGYGQTELGHGSNVQGLETEAHYDEKKQVFKIRSPKTTSAKFWPGVLGSGGTHSVTQAKTFVKEKFIGIQTFVVPIRDHNLEVLDGIEAGDIGPKLGFHRVDNGYLKINHSEIPRNYMLMKYIQVTPEGEVIGLENKEAIKYAYGSMLYLRVYLVYGFSLGYIIQPGRQLYKMYEQMGIAKQVDCRRDVIEYISLGIGMVMANTFTHKIYNQYITELDAKNFDKADKLLANCHILSATFKALSSWKALKVCTEIMTKNKYLVFRSSMMPQNFGNSFPSVTYEGDNSVLLQQTAKFILMKSKGEQVQRPQDNIRDDNIEAVLKMLKYVSAMEINRLKKIFEVEFGNGVGMKTFWNEKHQRDLIEVSKLWGVTKLVQGVNIALKDITENKQFFNKVARIFVNKMLEDAPRVYLYGFKVERSETFKTVSDDELWVMSHIHKPVDEDLEPHALIPRDLRAGHHAKL